MIIQGRPASNPNVARQAPATTGSKAALGAPDRVQIGGRRDDPPAPAPSPTPAPPDPTPPPPTPPLNPQPGAPGIGDPYFPLLGNGGYEAQHYTIDASVDVDNNVLNATTTMDATATQDLSSFNLDFRGFDIAKITVNGADAQFSRQDGELTVVPAQPIPNGSKFQSAVTYNGTPQPWDSQGAPFKVGWKHYDGGTSVDSEPDGASSWFPCNDHPRNKATFTYKIDVPKGFNVAANGTLTGTEDHDDRTRFTWEAKDPTATYLATVQIGNFVRQEDVGPNGLPIRNYFPPDMADAAKFDFGRQGEMIDYFSQRCGPFPLEAYGACVVPQSLVGGALECQTMSVFDPFVVTGDRSMENVVAHELFHNGWSGDNVSVKNWKDIWLNEGFASYGEWMWQEKTQGADSVKQTAQQVYDWLQGRQGGVAPHATPDCVKKMQNAVRHRGITQSTREAIEIGAPPSNDLFDEQVYMRGALTLYALRQNVGDDNFFNGMKTYFGQFKNGNAEIADFQAVMEKTSGKPLGDFFNAWLYKTDLPPFPG